MIAKKGFTKIVNFMTQGARVLMLGHDPTSHYSEYALTSTLPYTEHYLLVLYKGIIILFPMPLLIFIYSIMGC